MYLHFLLLLLTIWTTTPGLALIVLNPESNQNQTYYHIIAQFGPSTFDVEAPLFFADPEDLCAISNQVNTTLTQNSIILSLRGSCNFVEKGIVYIYIYIYIKTYQNICIPTTYLLYIYLLMYCIVICTSA